MPVFSYEGFDETGHPERGKIDAPSERIAFETLTSRGIVLSRLSTADVDERKILFGFLRLNKPKFTELNARDQATVAELLSTLFSAKLPVLETMRIVAVSSKHSHVTNQFERIRQRIADGADLS